ncbi:ERI1 exoribonuclease 3 isoform X3 [Balaenoptera ricei]|uniref:ERI1 exoribonuclease 3 isoform X6 n=3 Tax=Balaenoptera acutorostrata TaxID=9767 RepID=A0ABM3TV47_BALAC|nr:ERI1 exoribonuclease 3 isoform X8 [Orcinus orca]XP_057405983.1 ERI1 exoribonuclease 3 isoform X6 [Balaenoptera acutorostrata]XP_059777098.1 ERI1 exoribonuclease 3 isoform X3 [Balaenoptera ricei]
MATASPAADGGRGRPWEGGLVSWPPAPPLTIPWTWMGPSWGQHPGHWGFPALTEPSASPAASLGIFEVRRVLDASGCSMLAPLQTGAARFSSYLLSRARKVLGSHLFSPCGVPEFCSISTRKLAAHSFGASMAAMMSFPPQRYHYFLVLDFEATCDKPQIHPQEIIEFPILKLNGRTMEIESTFHMYVQPVVHPQLTPFCTELTGIIQAMVDGQPSLQQVLELLQEVRPARLPHCSLPLDASCLSGVQRLRWRVDEWMAKEGLLDPNVKSIFVTCGDWDLKVMLPGQCQYLGLPVADYFKQWINLKKAYSFAMGCWPKNGLLDMNKGLSLQHIGRPHSGIDDCKNIANIMKTLAYRGFIFKQTSKPF